SQRLWQTRFGAAPNIVGQTVTLDERTYTVIGVLPPSFNFFPASDWLAPLALNAEQLTDNMNNSFRLVARLKQGVPIERAQQELIEIRYRLNHRRDVRITTLREQLVKDFRPTLFSLWGMVATLLLIACANFANLLLLRGANRHKEIAIRAALGARRGRIVRQLLTESVLLAILGGALGLLFAYFAIHILVAANPAVVPSGLLSKPPNIIP